MAEQVFVGVVPNPAGATSSNTPCGIQERGRLAREAAFDVQGETKEALDEVERAVEPVMVHPHLDPGWRPVVRAMIAVKSSVAMLCMAI